MSQDNLDLEQNVQNCKSKNESKPSRDQKNDNMEESQQQFPSELTTTFYTSEVSKLAAHFRSSSVNGLCEEVAAVRLKYQGLNIVELNKELPLWIQFIRSFCVHFSLLLWTAAGLMLINWLVFPLRFSSNYYLVVIVLLLFAIVATGLSVFWREWQTTTALQQLKRIVDPRKCWVIRDGRNREIHSSELVVGDLVVVHPGSKIPADLRLVSCIGMRVDKSVLTGDTQEVRVSAAPECDGVSVLVANNTLLMGSSIVEGSGTAIVIATGKCTQVGTVTHLSNNRSKAGRNILEVQLARATMIISIIATVAVGVIIIYWVFYYRWKLPPLRRNSTLVINIVTLMIAFVPLGLPMVTTLGLAIIARRLRMKHHIMSKHTGGMITLGAATVLAVDKTGTLTENRITVARLISCLDLEVIAETKSEIGDVAYPTTSHSMCDSHIILRNSFRIAVMCNKEKLTTLNELQIEIMRAALHTGLLQTQVPLEVGRRSTAYGLMNWVSKDENVSTIASSYHVHAVLRDHTSTVVASNVATGDTFVFISGHIERVLPLCVKYLDAHGNEKAMSVELRSRLLEIATEEASHNTNILALAQLGPLCRIQFPTDFQYHTEPCPNFPTAGFTFVSCLALSDPVREGVRETMEQVRAANVLVAVITGDSDISALSTAREAGLVTGAVHTLSSLHCGLGSALRTTGETVVVDGERVDRMSSVEWQYVLTHRTAIYARTFPTQKELIVRRYQERGHIVAVTGDGLNDCPALQTADVGIAVNNATEVTRGVADMVLLCDDFMGVVGGIRAGRLEIINLRKTIAFMISAGCWPVVLFAGAYFFLGIPQPILILHSVLISCTSEVFCGVALMCELPERDLMTHPPRQLRTARLLDLSVLVYSYMFYGNMAAIGGFVNYFLYMASRGDTSQLHGNTIPVDFDPTRLPIGYRLNQLIFAWNFGSNTLSPYGMDQIAAWQEASTVVCLTLVMAQLGQLLSIRCEKPYFFDRILQYCGNGEGNSSRVQIQWSVVYAWTASVVTVVVFMYTPVNRYCNTAPLAARWWGLAVGWSALWFAVAEIRKWWLVLHPDSWLQRWAWQ